MKNMILLRKYSYLLTIVILAACANVPEIYSTRDIAPGRTLSRTVVVEYFDRVAGRAVAQSIEAKLTLELRQRGIYGVVASPINRNPAEFAQAVKNLVNTYNAKEILYFDLGKSSVNVAGVVEKANYNVTLVDTQSDQILWHAQLQWAPGSPFEAATQRADRFVASFLLQLDRDGFIPSQKTPQK